MTTQLLLRRPFAASLAVTASLLAMAHNVASAAGVSAGTLIENTAVAS
jgi:hypothetical protein